MGEYAIPELEATQNAQKMHVIFSGIGPTSLGFP